MAKQQKGGGSRKIDRNRKWCQQYQIQGRRERNKARRIARHERLAAKQRVKKAQWIRRKGIPGTECERRKAQLRAELERLEQCA